MKHAIIIAVLFVCSHAQADEASKRAKISKLVAAQGLELMFQQQLDASKVAMIDLGKNIVRSLADPKVPETEEQKRIAPVFNRFVARTGEMFSAKELVDSWASHYGKNLTEAEIDKILAYYTSPIGQKDVKSSQAAMVGFSTMMSAESNNRAMKLLDQLKIDLNAALKK
ncbi:MAG: DUF2059 domain-containing protein [Telluria sp.]